MKKNYTVSLDEEQVEFLRPYLDSKGLSFSGFLNEAVKEYVDAIKNLNLPDNVADMRLGDFMQMFSKMVKGMKKK